MCVPYKWSQHLYAKQNHLGHENQLETVTNYPTIHTYDKYVDIWLRLRVIETALIF